MLCGLVDVSDPVPSTKVTCEAHLAVGMDAVVSHVTHLFWASGSPEPGATGFLTRYFVVLCVFLDVF